MTANEDIFLTMEEAESIVAADQVGMYDSDYPGAKSKLAHARLLLANRPKEVVRKGECLKCGLCCEKFPLVLRGQFVKETDLEEVQKSHPFFVQIGTESVPDSLELVLVFRCTNHNPDGTCSIYEERPELCKIYPDTEKSMLDWCKCGFYFEEEIDG